MAEAAGLAIGVLSLAGLCSTCLEAFSLIGACKDFGIDSEIMSIKLDIEKTRLLQWAEATGLVTDDRREQNDHLLSSTIQPQIERILSAVIMLLTKSEGLRQRYGLCTEDAPWHAAADDQGLTVSAKRYQRFETAFTRLQERLPRRQNEASLATKVRWVIKDRTKFEELLKNLHDLVSGVIDLVALPKSFQRLLIKEDIDAIPDDLSNLRLIQAASNGQSQDWCDFSSFRVEMSQRATQDFRTLEEWLEDIVDAEKAPASTLPRLQPLALSQNTEMDGYTDVAVPKSLQTPNYDFLTQMSSPPLSASKYPQQIHFSPDVHITKANVEDVYITKAMVELESLGISSSFQLVTCAFSDVLSLLTLLLQGLEAREGSKRQNTNPFDIRRQMREFSRVDSYKRVHPGYPSSLWRNLIANLETKKADRSRDAAFRTYSKFVVVQNFIFDFTGSEALPSDQPAVFEFRVSSSNTLKMVQMEIEIRRLWAS